MKHPSWCN